MFCIVSFTPFLVAPGIDTPEPVDAYLNGAFPAINPGGGTEGWDVELAYPNLTFTDPIAMIELPDQSGFYIACKPGYIWKISKDANTTTKTLVLDFSAQVLTDGDAGVVNMVLHPEFGQPGSPNRGYMYVMYRYHPDENASGCSTDAFTRVSRFTKIEGTDLFDLNSEYVLVQQFDTHCWHTGGGMFFDNEGYFYFTFGDAGGSNDVYNTAQQIDQMLLSGLMRIDLEMDPNRNHPIRRQPVDPPDKPSGLPSSFTQGYYIPNDNPWLDPNGGILEEFYALGLRSPHRATYDPVTGDIWMGDVGQGEIEEISILEKGGNYQWPYREGTRVTGATKPSPLIGVDRPPVYEYSHSVGNSVIGGFVYRGQKYASSLGGKYIFGDHGVRNIWTLNLINSEVVYLANVPGSGVGSKNGISSFATDAAGEVYILKLYGTDLDGGQIYKLKQLGETTEPPQLLSETGAFTDLVNLTPAPGLVPYKVNAPLWSDRAAKHRWIALPNDGAHDTADEQIIFSANSDWQFPPGTVFVKHFELPDDENDPSSTVRLETRFFVLTDNGGGYGVTYKWNDEQTDATLLTTGEVKDYTVTQIGGGQTTQTWEFPSRPDCMTCHNANAGFVLGANTWQLNGDLQYPSGITDNQLNTWNHLGMFANPFSPAEIPSFLQSHPIDDESVDLETRVKSYIDANCAFCHRPNGVQGVFDARFPVPMENQYLINQPGVSPNTPSGGVIVKPKDPAGSELWVRDNSLANNKMPPLAKNIVHDEWIAVLSDWINGLEEPVCTVTYLTDLNWEGTAVNGWGPVEVDMSNGETGAGDGTVLTINGQIFNRGLGVHAYSEIIYNIGGQYTNFKSHIGVDDECDGNGTVQFEVYTDGSLAYQSPVLTYLDDALPITVDVTGVNELKLVVIDGGDGRNCDHGDWADARLEVCTEPDCNSTETLAVNEVPIIAGLYQAKNSITSAGEVESGTAVTFKAGNAISLLPGFHAKSGGEFQALIEACPPSSENLVAIKPPVDKTPESSLEESDSGAIDGLVANRATGRKKMVQPVVEEQQGCGDDCPEAGTPCDDHNPRTSGDVEDGNCNCTGTADQLPVSAPGGNSFFTGDLQVEARPNPFQNEFFLLIRRPAPELRQAIVRILDANGRIIHQLFDAPFDDPVRIYLNQEWPPGIYFIRVQASQYFKTIRVVKQ